MPPAAKGDPTETVAKIVAAAKDAAAPAAKGAALAPLLELFGDASAVPPILDAAGELLAEVSATLEQVASTPAADLTAELASAAGSASQLTSAFCDSGAAAAAVAACAGPLMTLVTVPAAGKWSEADLTESRAALLSSACSAIQALASHHPGRFTLHRGGAAASLLALVQPSLASQPALQVQAAIALSRLAEAPLSRAALGADATLAGVVSIVAQLKQPSLADATAVRLQAKLVLLLGFCLYDGQLRPALLEAGLLATALTLVEPPEADPEAEEPEPSPEAQQCAAELKSNAATVLAIGGQSAAGREILVGANGLDALCRLLLASASPSEDGAPPSAASDQALAALLANVTLALAHVALTPAAAVVLGKTPNVLSALTALIAPSTGDATVAGWAAVRGNACTALMHILHQPPGRHVYLTAPATLPGASPPDVTEGEEEAPPPPPPSALSAITALVASASPTTDEEGESVAPEETDLALVATAADILSQMASEYAGRAAVVAAGGDAALIALLTFGQPDALLEPVTCAVAALANEPSACIKLRGKQAALDAPTGGEGGEEEAPPAEEGEGAPAEDPPAAAPSPLTIVPTLLASASVGVQRAGASLVITACSDSLNASTLVQLGVPPTLVELAKQHEFAKSATDALCAAVPSAMLWHTGCLPPNVQITDGFYGVTADCDFVSVDDLATSNSGSEVLLVNAASDGPLAIAIAEASELVASSADAGASAADVAAGLARLVCDRLGGAIPHEAYQHFEGPAQEVDALRAHSLSRVLPLGSISLGAARHRALLFKTLADRTGMIQVGLQMGACRRGAHAYHAWNTMIVDGMEVVVDVLHAPGEFYPEGSDAARRYKRIDEHAFSSLTSGMLPM